MAKPDRPTRVVIELARRLDMHPADLIYELDTVLTNPRHPCQPPGAEPADANSPDCDPLADARVLLAALAHASYPLTTDQLAHALEWKLPRAHAALAALGNSPALAGPMALRRLPPDHYTLTPRLDTLTHTQHHALTTMRPRFDILTRNQAATLHTVITTGYTDAYRTHPGRDPYAETQLLEAGLIHGDADRGEPVYASYTKPSKRAIQSIKDKVSAKTYRSTRHQDLDELLRSLNMSLVGWANHFRHGVSKASFSAVDHHAWHRLMRWIRAKYKGKTGLSVAQMRRRFCDVGWRFAHNGVVFTGASSVTVTRYRYRGGNIPTPWTPKPPAPPSG